MHFEIYTDKAGEFRWRLVAGNGNIIATGGDGYKHRKDCEHGIDLVKSTTSATEVREK
ncbi:YegP family protein [Actinobacillus delphinicola]|uniref:YegP family protein n=1 Tax=Actinobacillus delphinicola TaxID=51161 RepID=UPI0024413BAA|nr:DUF1508 domain-containing protein [Actinobacillus delphinicola]